tara:strand:- start:5969 stop:6778 length:810 start_codon:yes stop_codon:yes gene_type:complete
MPRSSPQSPRIFAITNQKGGVGKTTTSVNLATAFSAMGHNVLLIDMDPQGNAGTGLGIRRSVVKHSVYDVLFDRVSAAEAILKTKVPRLSIMPSSVHLSGADVELSSAKERESRLKRALSSVEGYDYIVIDCPPSLNFLTLNALSAAQSIIVPLQCEFFALEGLSQLTKTVKLVQKHYNPALDIHGIVLTMYDKRNRITKLVADDVRGYFKEKVYNTTIPRNVRLSEAPSYGLPALVYDMKSTGAQAYIKLAREILNREKEQYNQAEVA